MDSPRSRRWAWMALGLITLAVITITFWPTPVDRPFHLAIGRVLATLHRHGLPHWVTYAAIESASNVVMFVPIGALIAILVRRSLWWVSGVLGLLASVCIELSQLIFLPARYASLGDVAANTSGALLGGAIICILRYIQTHRSPA
ncbi:VanZ family protein [Agreia sp. PsM10]|uniref:VanZ family protein n=1 Tax=Agreia sp. PsM10 TaxID=3030533 RepID=UPI00263B15D6|nr:VanZ family protein [Agreia sp. PsM10]MDN4641321.1 VanZ family protein [Agreia sp. PsM10]